MVGRMQIFNNWSPYLVANQDKVWIGLEYFCYETDAIWKQPDEEMIELAKEEIGEDRNHRSGGRAGRLRDPRAENLSGLLRSV